MPDPRALANTRNLTSYRAWLKEGYQRSGFAAITLIVGLLAPVIAVAPALAPHAARDGQDLVLMVGGAFTLYLTGALGSSVFAVLRLRAWKRAHPWAPPSPNTPLQTRSARAA